MWSRERDLDEEEGYSRSQGKLREGMVGTRWTHIQGRESA